MSDVKARNAGLMLVSAAAAAAVSWLAVRYVPIDGLSAIARSQGLAIAPAIAYIASVLWKVNDAKRVDGLTGRQQRRLLKTARLIIVRLTIFIALAVGAAALGLMSYAFESAPRVWAWIVGGSITGMIFVIFAGVPYTIWLKFDLMRFEDLARTRLRDLQQREEIRKRLADRKDPQAGS